MSNELVIAASYCTSCGNALAAGDRFCGQCGRPVNAVSAGSSVPQVTRSPLTEDDSPVKISLAPELRTIVANRWIVMGILLVVGPLGLPALWFSPRFRPWVKVTITVFYFAATALFPLVLAWYWLDFALQPLVDVFAK